MPPTSGGRVKFSRRPAVVSTAIMCLGLLACGRLEAAAPAPDREPAATQPRQTLATQPQFLPPTAAEARPTAWPEGELAAVVRVVDGDTIDVSLRGQTAPVRYIGVNSPERNEACSREATAANARLVEGTTVRLVKDVSERDKFDRLLRYVYAGDLFVNAELVAQGYAQAADFPPDTRYSDRFHALEAQARAAGLGCHPTGVFDDSGAALATQPPAPGGSGACDPAYPTVCIPPPPPDLDCGEIGYRRFSVLPPDPHSFDGDKDGVGCQN